jgi:hypothetical protein
MFSLGLPPLKTSKSCQPPQQVQILPGNHCNSLLKDNKNKVIGLPFMMNYHTLHIEE